MIKAKFIFLVLVLVQAAFSSNLKQSEFEDDVVLLATEDKSITLSTLSSSYVGVLEIPKDSKIISNT